MAGEITAADVVSRFWAKVDRRGPDDCWEWLAGVGSQGYGSFYPSRSRQVLAHRFSLSLVDEAPSCAHALHSCDNKRCVNPAHLRWGTHAENMQDAVDRNRTYAPNARRSTCPHGHELTNQNVILRTVTRAGRKYQSRTCRECNRIYLANRRTQRAKKGTPA